MNMDADPCSSAKGKQSMEPVLQAVGLKGKEKREKAGVLEDTPRRPLRDRSGVNYDDNQLRIFTSPGESCVEMGTCSKWMDSAVKLPPKRCGRHGERGKEREVVRLDCAMVKLVEDTDYAMVPTLEQDKEKERLAADGAGVQFVVQSPAHNDRQVSRKARKQNGGTDGLKEGRKEGGGKKKRAKRQQKKEQDELWSSGWLIEWLKMLQKARKIVRAAKRREEADALQAADVVCLDISDSEEVKPNAEEVKPRKSKKKKRPESKERGGKKEKVRKADEVDTECVVCLGAQKQFVCVPCMHMCLCARCAELVQQSTHECPLCRAAATQILQVFF